MLIPTKLMLYLTKSQSKFQFSRENTYNAEKKSMSLTHEVLSQNSSQDRNIPIEKWEKRTSQLTTKFKWPIQYREMLSLKNKDAI